MTNDQLKEVLFSKKPVECNGITYRRISALIYRKNEKGGLRVQVELEDMKAHSVTIAEPSRVNEIKNDMTEGNDG